MTGDTTPLCCMNDLLACAREAASAAASHAFNHAGRRHDTIQVSCHDVKLRLDVECQEIAESVIRSVFPLHDILGEEDASIREGGEQTGAASPYEWIIDPIDGTVNFYHGMPIWCSSVAVRLKGEVVAGAIAAPGMSELYLACVDQPATCNGRPLSVSDVETLDRAMVTTGMDKRPALGVQPLSIMNRIALNTQKARVLGSAALDLCHVAAGRCDGYFEAGIYLWDVAAAGLMVRRAGGRTDVLHEGEGHRMAFLASNGRLHEALRDLVTTGN
jgi:myo-inositol-1(or 4)-monophosphatase